MVPMREGRSGGADLAYGVAITIARTSIGVVTRDEWHGADKLPREGGFLVCANHISHADPFAVARFLYDSGHPPYFLAKESLFELPVFGRLLRGAGQIPVRRGTNQAHLAYEQAVVAVEAGKCVVVMPESTITKDPDKWPMTGKTGAARIALATGRPVIPLAQWGSQFVRHVDGRPGWGRAVSRMRVGDPVPLDDLRDREADAPMLREATERIMGAITAELEQLRGEDAPVGRWDLRAGRRVASGTQEDYR